MQYIIKNKYTIKNIIKVFYKTETDSRKDPSLFGIRKGKTSSIEEMYNLENILLDKKTYTILHIANHKKLPGMKSPCRSW